jgi:hypothetical protein
MERSSRDIFDKSVVKALNFIKIADLNSWITNAGYQITS